MNIPIKNNQLPVNSPIAITINRGKGNLQKFIWYLRRETTIGCICTEQQNTVEQAYDGQFFPRESTHITARPVRLGLIENK